MIRYAAIVWDLDGTIVDSLPVIYEAFSRMLEHYGRPPVSREWMRERIGHPFRETMNLVGLGDDAQEYYRSVYFSLAERHKPFAGIEEVLHETFGKIPMVIVSNKSREGILRSLGGWNGEKWFDLIVSENDMAFPKPHPSSFDVVRDFWKRQQKPLEASDVLMIGDTEIDEAFARAVGMDFAFASWGYGKPKNPTFVLQSPSDILGVVGLDEVLPLCTSPELDLHGFASHEVDSVVKGYLAEAVRKGYREVRIITGKGRSVKKQQVERILREHPLVAGFRESHPLFGGWGSYQVVLREEE